MTALADVLRYFITSFDLSASILVFLLAAFTYTMWKISKSGRVHLADMIRGRDGLASAGRFIALGGWIFSSWGLMVLILDYVRSSNPNKPFPTEYAVLYLTICIGGYAINKGTEALAERKNGAPPSGSKPQ